MVSILKIMRFVWLLYLHGSMSCGISCALSF